LAWGGGKSVRCGKVGVIAKKKIPAGGVFNDRAACLVGGKRPTMAGLREKKRFKKGSIGVDW